MNIIPSKRFQPAFLASGLALALCSPWQIQAQHGHLNVGASGTSQNDRLIWANGAEFIDSSSYVKTLNAAISARYTGYFEGNITLTALPQFPEHAGPDPLAPALGSFIQFRMSCLEGPPGGAFQFWESTGDVPAESLLPGQTSTNLWPLSENDGSPGSDPYGHIHGRRFTATKPGIYKIGFQALDTSNNGAGGGPIHTPSEILPVWFQAGVNFMSIEPDYEESHVHITFGALAGYAWQVQYSAVLGPQADWRPAGNSMIGSDYFVEMIHDLAPGTRRYYRLVGTPIEP